MNLRVKLGSKFELDWTGSPKEILLLISIVNELIKVASQFL